MFAAANKIAGDSTAVAWLNDLKGGVAAAVVSVPLVVGFGLFAFAPLGERYAGFGVQAGLCAAAVASLTALLLGARSPLIFAPRSITSFLVNAIALQLVGITAAHHLDTPAQVLAVLLLTFLLAGAIQALFGALRLGDLAKYIPFPVIAGFQNGAALLLLFSQIDPLLGLHGHTADAGYWNRLHEIQPLTLAIGLASCAVMLYTGRLTRRIPATIVAVLGGCALYYLLAAMGFGHALGPVIGDIGSALPDTAFLRETAGALGALPLADLGPLILAWAITLALIGSLDALLVCKVLEHLSRRRSNGDRMLFRLGLGNCVAAGLGAIPSAVSLVSSQANHAAGGRSRRSVMIFVVLIVMAGIFAGNLIAIIPKVVIAALLMVTALHLFDRWTLRLIMQLARGKLAHRSAVLFDLAVVATVAGAAIFTNLVMAGALGVIAAIIAFLLRMSRSIIRRSYSGDAARSRKAREEKVMGILDGQRHRIRVFELEGVLFFGTAERLAVEVERAVENGADHVILDLRRVSEIDSTGAQLLSHLNDDISGRGRHLTLAAVDEHTRIGRSLKDMGVLAAFTHRRFFPDTDHAIEVAEDLLILAVAGANESGLEFPFHDLEVLEGASAQEIARLRPMFARREFAAGEAVFREGAPGSELYVIARGTASVKLRRGEGQGETRLVTFAPGTVFGELALLDTEVRSATVVADEPLVCFVLNAADFEKIKIAEPRIAILLLTNLARLLSERLRRSNRMIHQLDN